jgi:hypothetical protein
MKMHVSDSAHLSLRKGEGRVRVAYIPQTKFSHLPPSLGYGAAGNPLPENGERRTCKRIS